MADIVRLYDFLSGQPIRSGEVDDEFNQLIERSNNIPEDALDSALLAKLAALGASVGGALGRGKCIVSGEQSSASSAYALMATPDRVDDIVLPTDGLLLIGYQAAIKQSGDLNARAAIFLNANQLKVADGLNVAVQEAQFGPIVITDRFRPLATTGGGLYLDETGSAASNYAGDVTTGQVLGTAAGGTGYGGGGFVVVFAAAGTYDVSVKFGYTQGSGSVSAKQRKLWVEAHGF